jgi:hypothetical protein
MRGSTTLYFSNSKTPTKCTSIYLHLTHLHVSVLSDHLQGALVTEYLDISMCLSTVQSLFIYVQWGHDTQVIEGDSSRLSYHSKDYVTGRSFHTRFVLKPNTDCPNINSSVGHFTRGERLWCSFREENVKGSTCTVICLLNVTARGVMSYGRRRAAVATSCIAEDFLRICVCSESCMFQTNSCVDLCFSD